MCMHSCSKIMHSSKQLFGNSIMHSIITVPVQPASEIPEIASLNRGLD